MSQPCDILGAFMQADNDEVIHMRMRRIMAELLVKLDPKLYRKYISIKKGKKVMLYVIL